MTEASGAGETQFEPSGRVFRAAMSAILVLLPLLAGCQALGVLAYKLFGNAPVKAQYVPAQQPMLVLVETYSSPAASGSESNQLAILIGQELAGHNVAPVVGQDQVQVVRGLGEEQYRKMSIGAIGRAAGAKQVLYVNITGYQSSVAPAEDVLAGKIQAQVRLIDADTGTALWPAEEAGHPISHEIQPHVGTAKVTAATVRDELLAGTADRIAKLFYTYRPEGNEGAGDR